VAHGAGDASATRQKAIHRIVRIVSSPT